MTLNSRQDLEAQTLVEVLRRRAESHPDRRSLIFLADGEEESETLDYGRLDERARAVAALLRSHHTAGDRVLLLIPPSLDFVAAFLGCLYAGAVAVPSPAPMSSRALMRIESMIEDCRPSVVLTNHEVMEKTGEARTGNPLLSQPDWLCIEDAGHPEEAPITRVTGGDLAFLQYTSGSTSAPKGVEVTHGNLMANMRMIEEGTGHAEDTPMLSWLPMYHDMGLIGCLLQPLYLGTQSVLMPPIRFIQKPIRWLRAVSKYRPHTSGGPNFAYDLCVDRTTPEERQGLDLSSWRVAFNGAEPVRAGTLESFAHTFAEYGFRAEGHYPNYGLAEGTLIVGGGRKNELPVVRPYDTEALEQHRAEPVKADAPTAGLLVSSGRTIQDQRIAIVDPQTGRCLEDRKVGEIWVSGDNVARGYWGRPEETEATFGAHLADEPDAGVFLRTGDLGFLDDQELFVTGRSKDLIIIHGRNIYPQDVELMAERSHPALAAAGGAAFALDREGEERLILVHELTRQYRKFDLAEVAAAARAAVLAEFEVPIAALYLIKPGRAPKTSSGKIMRHRVKQNLMEDVLDEVWADIPSAPQDPMTQSAWNDAHRPDDVLGLLCVEMGAALGILPETVDTGCPVQAFGLDSLAAAGLAHRIEERLGFDVPLTTFMQDRSLSDLAPELTAERERRHRAGGWPEPPAAPSEPHAEAAWLPMTRGQKALWFQQHLMPDSSAYNVNLTIELRGSLDRDALRRTLAHLVQCHQVLRLCPTRHHGEPAWHPFSPAPDAAPLGLTEIGADGLTDEEVLRLVIDEAHQPFPMDGPPLARAVLYRHGHRHLLLICLHHLICDGWSMNVLYDDLRRFYAAARTGSPLPTPSGRPYVDHLRSQEGRLAGEPGTRDLSYWRRHLADLPPMLTLPVARPRPPVQTFLGGSVPLVVPKALSDDLRVSAKAAGVTPFVLLLAAFQILLGRYSRNRTFALGTISSGRTRPGFEETVGYFANPLVLKADIDDQLSFTQFAQGVRDVLLEALEHQELPFSALVEQINPVRDPSAAPLFQIAFGLTDIGGETGKNQEDLTFTPLILDQQEGQFDLNLEFFRTDDELKGTFNYADGLFDSATVTHMAQHYLQLVADAIERPDTPVRLLDMTPGPARVELENWSLSAPPTAAGDHSELIHDLIAKVAAKTPEAPAVRRTDSDDADLLTYGELDRRAGCLATLLRQRGVGRDVPVGIFLKRSPEMVVAVLATLKAGGAYLPLDPSYPREHLATLIEDGAPRVILADDSLLSRLPDNIHSLAVVLPLSQFPLEGDPQPLEEQADPESLAYVIFTSGSTGRPKGVMLPHRAAVHRLNWKVQALGIGPEDRLLQSIPLSFDPSVWELFAPLIAGAQVVLPRAGIQQDPAEMVAVMAHHGISLISCVPSLLAHLTDQPGLADCHALRHVICGGEPLTGELADRFGSRSKARLHHFYGPTEATIYATHWLCRNGDSGRLPIGRPVAGAHCHVVDENLHSQPVGVPGELVIGGAGLARGYMRRPDLTERAFVSDPLSDIPQARLYRTGDLAMWRPDGTLQFLERLDNQIKVRGFRVEPGAIEGKLRDHPAVAEAVVTLHTPGGSEGSLVAYVVSPGLEGLPSGLRGFLTDRLPAYMVPTYLISLEALPLLPSGKVDLAALPEPTGTESSQRAPYAAPSTNMEAALVRIWEEVLHQPRIGVRDNFLELGGHSLMALRLVTRIQEDMGLRISPMAVMQTPTIEALALELQKAEERAHGYLVQVQNGHRGIPVFYVAPGHGDLVSFSVLARRIDPSRPFYALVPPRRPGETLQLDIGELAERYVEEMRTRHPDGPYLIAGFSLGGVVALEVARLLRAEGRTVAPVILLDTFFPYLPGLSHSIFKMVRALALAVGKPAEKWFHRPLQQIFTDQGLTAQVEAMRRFKPQPYPGPVVLIMSTTAKRLRALLFRPWRRLLVDLRSTEPVTGWHDQMFQDPHIIELARIIEPHLTPPEKKS
ncbi:non-ribosomal peptide synthetase [Magnetospira sp. QH-2]|uniref:non-ribosomal peptide synthetase n=1 Tax=Magnetospira sp. (strain QH-2) TaxID=1288970 RepID=UPI0003E8146D|nr:non-ribosomal peptide synthetase [Magnetospira sp. QH-2]CCQ72949.1 putative non ribosomal peptide synthase [Magnetospira sp. QH-2]